MDERLRFVARLLEGEKMAPLCAEFGISPRHAPSWWGQSVTHPLGIRCYLSLRKDIRSQVVPPSFSDLSAAEEVADNP